MFASLINRLPHIEIPVHGRPYLTRYFLDGRPIAQIGERAHVYLHHFHSSDQATELHNHPWSATSLILRGGYIEESAEYVDGRLTPVKSRMYRLGDINHISANTFHRVSIIGDTWTLCRVSARVQEWGFVDRTTHKYRPFDTQESTVVARRVVDILRDETDETTVFQVKK